MPTRCTCSECLPRKRAGTKRESSYTEAYNNLGVLLEQQGDLDEAVVCYRRALKLRPGHAAAHNNLGGTLLRQGRPQAAAACYRRALELKPDFADAHNGLGIAMTDLGRLDEAKACHERALETDPDLVVAMDSLLCLRRYQPGITSAALAEACGQYERRLAASLRGRWRSHENPPDPDRPLRLGFVSPRFGDGPVGAFLLRTLENLDRGQCHVICYSDGPMIDARSLRFQSLAVLWRAAGSLTDQQLADRVREDGIDLLFDLAGHSAKNRLRVFARKPAPIQVTWIDSVGTTGLKAIDYLLADRYLIPAEAESYYTERVLRLPDGYVCYDPPGEAPAVGPLPAATRGHVTFGSFNQPAKMNLDVMKLWSRVLQRTPGSRLILKYRALDDAESARNWRQAFQAEGVAPDRLEFQGHSPRAVYFAEYGKIDVTLDPFPHNGGLTTCDSLWMGVPVVTCPGETFAGRQSLSHLSNVGLTETIARDLDEYVSIAVGLASDLSRLAALRAGLRRRVGESPLCDGKRFAENLMKLLRGVWREWCQG